jgi:hypothetical protein
MAQELKYEKENRCGAGPNPGVFWMPDQVRRNGCLSAELPG